MHVRYGTINDISVYSIIPFIETVRNTVRSRDTANHILYGCTRTDPVDIEENSLFTIRFECKIGTRYYGRILHSSYKGFKFKREKKKIRKMSTYRLELSILMAASMGMFVG